MTPKPEQVHEIMQKPLPEILDEIKAMITQAQLAAGDATAAAEEAKGYSDTAAVLAEKAATEAISEVKAGTAKQYEGLRKEIESLGKDAHGRIDALKGAISRANSVKSAAYNEDLPQV